MENSNQKQKILRLVLIVVSIILLLNVLMLINKDKKETIIKDTDYVNFVKEIKEGKVESVTITERKFGPRKIEVKPKEGTKYEFNAVNDPSLLNSLMDKDVKTFTVEEPGPSVFETIFYSYGPTILFLVIWIWIMKKMSGGGKGGLFGVNKSKAQLIDPSKLTVSFDDVVGCDEAKVEAKEFIDFLKNPEKFSKLGGRTPRGLLLTGPSGTGKTLMAKALAKESGVPFFFTSGSEFVEMFVGVGASRVRDMFETAKKAAPCVLFIDEIDAIGGKRSSGGIGNGGHDEKEQTLNQILVEMDGMETNKGIILVGATNRPEILDPALLRPGRFDRQIVVQLPDVKGREQILKIHSTNVPLDKEVSLAKIARGTSGFSGAQLESLINEAAIFAARKDKKFVEQVDFEKAKDKLVMGIERPSLAMSDEDKRKTAYHESGHAVVAKLVKNTDPVHKVTIIPRGRALGVTMQLPEKDKFSHEKGYLEDRIAILMGGRAAEEVFCNTFTNGASNDIAVATDIAKKMVTEWGMSSLGPIAFGNQYSGGFLGSSQWDASSMSPKALETVEKEIHTLINSKYDLAKRILTENSDIVEAMTNALMEIETIDDWHIENIMARRKFDDPIGYEQMLKKQELA